MSNVLVFIQQDSGKIQKSALSALAAALQLKDAWKLSAVKAVVLGAGAKQAATEISSYSVDQVVFSESANLEKYTASNYAPVIQEIMTANDCSTLVLAATSTGKDLAPRISAAISAGQASEIIAINPDGSLKRPVYAGNAFADVEITTALKVVTVRASAFAAAIPSGATANCNEFTGNIVADERTTVVSYEIQKGERPELTSARVVVSGGRALQSAENFNKYLVPLADELGAALGASRAAVDSGYVPNDWQVGQTGKVVAPDLYIAVGISGAIQHLAGMKDSKTIVAINKDGDAPIFEIADYGLVGDLYEIIPQLTQEIKKAKA